MLTITVPRSTINPYDAADVLCTLQALAPGADMLALLLDMRDVSQRLHHRATQWYAFNDDGSGDTWLYRQWEQDVRRVLETRGIDLSFEGPDLG